MTRRWRLVRWVLVLVLASCSGGEESGGGPSTTPAPSPPSTPAPTVAPTPAPPTPAPVTPATSAPPPPAPTAAPTPTPPTASPTPSPEAGDDDEETTAAALPVAPPSAESPTGAYFAATDSPLSRELYLERVADQVDLRFHARRAEEVRFWMQSGIIQLRGAAPRGLGDPVAGSPGRPVARGRIGTVVDR
ncbi:MAG: hypothetical protein IT379_09630, partial [Deltaproteobacteria bacterium]|nr:hypothetical protein [Deltaproteobacteria bacterium]